MNKSKGLLSKRWFYWSLFVGLFAYAILRAWMVVPMLDELATFYSYIRTGHYFNTIELIDVNNHVLNSFFGHQFFRLFGDHFFLFRIASLISFPVYFFSIKFIVQSTIPKTVNTIVFLALVCVPWIFEYFSYSRGYGMAIAFFFAAIGLLIKWKESSRWFHLTGVFVCLWLAITASLTYLFPSILVCGLVGLTFISQRKFQRREIITLSGIVLIWVAAIVPFVRYSFRLKEAGALWWGNQDGLWESTGKSLSQLVVFTSESWVGYLIVLLLVTCAVFFFRNWVKNGFWAYLKETEAMVFLLFAGCLIGIVMMRFALNVNYPMDRVAMYLIPLFIIFISVFLSKQSFVQHVLFVLLFFPISFIFNMNLSTSIFSPEDRIPTYLTDQIKTKLTDQTTLSAEYVSHMSYAYSCRNDEKVHIAFTAELDDPFLGDYHISWLGRQKIQGYHTIAQDPASKTRLFQRDANPIRRLIVDTLMRDVNTNDMYLTCLKRPIDSLVLGSSIQVEISGDMKFDQATSAFNIIQSYSNDKYDVVSSRSPNFNWYFSDRTDVNFVYTDQIFQLNPEISNFHFFLLNGDMNAIKINFLRVRIYQIDY